MSPQSSNIFNNIKAYSILVIFVPISLYYVEHVVLVVGELGHLILCDCKSMCALLPFDHLYVQDCAKVIINCGVTSSLFSCIWGTLVKSLGLICQSFRVMLDYGLEDEGTLLR